MNAERSNIRPHTSLVVIRISKQLTKSKGKISCFINNLDFFVCFLVEIREEVAVR